MHHFDMDRYDTSYISQGYSVLPALFILVNIQDLVYTQHINLVFTNKPYGYLNPDGVLPVQRNLSDGFVSNNFSFCGPGPAHLAIPGSM